MVKVRSAIESLYSGKCSIYEYQKTIDEVTKTTKFKEVTVLSDQPCRLSKKDNPVAGDGNTSAISKTMKLFIAPEIVIKPGSKIVVSQNGITESYSNSGVPDVKSNHQEIMLTYFEGWA